MVQYFRPRIASSAKEEPVFSYTGDYLYNHTTDEDGTVHFDLALLTSGTLTFSRRPVQTAVFMQAAGDKGVYGRSASAAPGGNGGRRLETQIQLYAGTEYQVYIGDENQAATTAFGFSTEDDGSEAGGLGGHQGENTARKGEDGAVAFDGTNLIESLVGIKYGAGGGAGAWRNSSGSVATQGAGGATGGGAGGHGYQESDYVEAQPGRDNTGSGGGGGRSDGQYGANRSGGNGGTGIVLLRDIRVSA